jgi:hypothetical protein
MQGKFGDGATISLPTDLQGFNPAVPNLIIRLSLQPPKKKNSMVWVQERTIPTERPPLVGEVIANFGG